jgi:hypothetical protein
MKKLWVRILFGKARERGNVSRWSDKGNTIYQVGILRSILIDKFDNRHNWASHPIVRLFD